MKKINLSIPQPCHESWDQMTQTDKGRFCASCQKTVVDFTNMNDRQLAGFFKKPAGSVCGRFHQDQLSRDIEIQRKRIPWIKYFFQFSLPAFLVSMKANSQSKVAITGDTIIISRIEKKEITSKKQPAKSFRKKTTSIQNSSLISLSCKAPETVNISELKSERLDGLGLSQALQGTVGGVRIVVGGVSYGSKSTSVITKIVDSATRKVNTFFKKFSVYPNPVQRNSTMRIDLKKLEEGNYVVSVINMAGEVIQTEEVSVENKNALIDLPLKEAAAGTYFIHVFNRKTAASYSEKIIVQ